MEPRRANRGKHAGTKLTVDYPYTIRHFFHLPNFPYVGKEFSKANLNLLRQRTFLAKP